MPVETPVTIREIANRLNVSHTTVSLALRDDPTISQKRREEIKRLAEQLGYRPDPMLSSLVYYRNRHRSAKIQSALAWINHWGQPEMLRKFREFDLYWRGAEKSAERFGYRLEEIRWDENISPHRIEQILQTRNIRGLLIPPHAVVPDWGDFDWSKFCIVRFGMSVPTPDSHVVTADQQRGVLMAFRTIHEYGYQRISLVTGRDYDSKLGGNFIGGLAAAQELFGLKQIVPPLLTDLVQYINDPRKSRQALEKWLKKHRPDAILTTVPQLPGIIRELGLRIPQDVAVAGTSIYDIPVDAGINQNPEAIGRAAVEVLVAQINRNERGVPEAPCRTLVESTWQDGKSLPQKNL